MKHFIALSAFLLLCACTSPQLTRIDKTSEVSSTNTHNTQVTEIFSMPPKGEDSLILFDAYTAYHDKYLPAIGAKSFAQAPSGAWAYVTNQSTQEAANTDALARCEQHNQTFTETFPCQLINVAGQWLESDNQAVEILANLPKFTPAEPIDLRHLRSNTEDDLTNKNYALALAKRIWFHQNALAINPHYSAVRTSYGLIAWAELGELYPPAKTLMHYAANQLKQTLIATPEHNFSLMQEYVSFNDQLHREDRNMRFFKWLDTNHPKVAESSIYLFKDVLIKHKAFALFNKYTKPRVDYANMASSYVLSLDWQKQDKFNNQAQSDRQLAQATKSFKYSVARLVAVLVINNRQDEAELIVKKAKLELATEDFSTLLAKALKGELPQPI